MPTSDASIRNIYRCPVKGLSPEALAAADLAPGETVRADRLYAEVIDGGRIAIGDRVSLAAKD